MGDPGRFCEREETCYALCSLAVSERMSARPGPGSGRRPDYFLLSAGSSGRAAQDGVRQVPSQAAQGHLCLPAVLWGQVEEAVDPPAGKPPPPQGMAGVDTRPPRPAFRADIQTRLTLACSPEHTHSAALTAGKGLSSGFKCWLF